MITHKVRLLNVFREAYTVRAIPDFSEILVIKLVAILQNPQTAILGSLFR